jgi:hypothetical protein
MPVGLELSKIAQSEGEVRIRLAFFSTAAALLLVSAGACAPGARSGPPTAGVAPDRIPRITALYEQATARPVHPFRKPVRDEQARARRELQAECQRWLTDLRAEAVPTALTGQGGEKPIMPAADTSALQFSLEQLSSTAGHADPAAMRAAHNQALAAYRHVEGGLRTGAAAEN